MIADGLILLGSFVIFSGALGHFRLKDSFQRFHPAAKVSFLGLSLVILGEVIGYYLRTGIFSIQEILALPLILIVSPLGAHILARELYKKRSQSR